jgi:UDP-glucose 4-epimerase
VKKILVTGGAGYIGAHVVIEFLEAGYDVKVLDNLTTGASSRINDLDVEFWNGNIQDEELVKKASKGVNGVIHLAASKSVEESVRNPEKYFRNNFLATSQFMNFVDKSNLQASVFSSSAAVYSPKVGGLLVEGDSCIPPSPYGRSKLMCESIFKYLFDDFNLSSVILRYFNVIAARDRERVDNSDFNVVPKTLRRIQSGLPAVVNGSDYDTVDGSCVRDYVDVRDIARAHVLSFEHVMNKKEFQILNLGSGKGFSVIQVLHEIYDQLGLDSNIQFEPRRPGDPAYLVADYMKASRLIGWNPTHDLQSMISSALAVGISLPEKN